MGPVGGRGGSAAEEGTRRTVLGGRERGRHSVPVCSGRRTGSGQHGREAATWRKSYGPLYLERGGEEGRGDATKERGILGDVLTPNRLNWGLDHPSCFSEASLGALAEEAPAPRGSAPAPPSRGLAGSAVWDGKSEGCSRPAQ